MKRLALTLFLAMAAISFSGCSTLSNLVEKDESEWTVTDYWQHLKDAYDDEQWEQVIQYGEKLLAYYPYGKEAEQAYLYLAYAYYKWDEPESAVRILDEFIRLYPKHRALAYAYYLRARAQESVASSWFDKWITDPARRSAVTLQKTYDYYRALLEKFPTSQYAEVARRKVVIYYNRLARHEYHIARFYFEKGAYLASAERVRDLLNRYPRAAIILDALELMAADYDRLGMDVQADHVRQVLVANYEKQVQKAPAETPAQQQKARTLDRQPRYRSLRWSN